MKTVNKLGMNLFALMFLASAMALFAQTPGRPAPTFALAIEEKPLEAENTPGTHIFLVKYTNVSNIVQQDGCMVTPSAYSIVVLRDGVSVEKRKSKRVTGGTTEENGTRPRIHVTYTEADSCNGVNQGLRPGESVKFPLWVSSAYDLTAPGTYEITVTRETDRWDPNKSVTVKSNSLTIVVPESGAETPQ